MTKLLFILTVVSAFTLFAVSKQDMEHITVQGSITEDLLSTSVKDKINSTNKNALLQTDDGNTVEVQDTVEIIGGNNITTSKSGTKEISIKTNDTLKIPHKIILNHQERPANIEGISDDFESYSYAISDTPYSATDGLIYKWEYNGSNSASVSTDHANSGSQSARIYYDIITKTNKWATTGKYDITFYMYFDSGHNADIDVITHPDLSTSPSSTANATELWLRYDGSAWVCYINSVEGSYSNYITEDAFNKVQWIFNYDDSLIQFYVNDNPIYNVSMPQNTVEVVCVDRRVNGSYIDDTHIGTYTQFIQSDRYIAYEYDFDAYQNVLLFNQDMIKSLTKFEADNSSLKNITFYNTDEVAMEISDEVTFKNKSPNSLLGYKIGDNVSLTQSGGELQFNDVTGTTTISDLKNNIDNSLSYTGLYKINDATSNSNDTYNEGDIYLVLPHKINSYDYNITVGYNYPVNTNEIAFNYYGLDVTSWGWFDGVNSIKIIHSDGSSELYNVTNVTFEDPYVVIHTDTNFTQEVTYSDRTYMIWAGGDYNVNDDTWLGRIFKYENGQRVVLHDEKDSRADIVFTWNNRHIYTWVNDYLMMSKLYDNKDYIIDNNTAQITYPYNASRYLIYDANIDKIINIRPFDAATQILEGQFTPADEAVIWNWRLYDSNPHDFGFGGILVYDPTNDVIYYGMGSDIQTEQDSDTIYNTFFKYDVSNNDITSLATPVHSTTFASAYLYNGKIYMFGGKCDTGVSDMIQSYDIANNTWAIETQTLPHPLWKFGLATQPNTNEVYIFGGELSDTSVTNETYILNKNDLTFTQKSNLPNPVELIDGILTNGNVYTCGGSLDNNYYNNNISDIYKYNINSDSWSTLNYYNSEGTSIQLFKRNDKAYIYDINDNTNKQQYIDLSDDSLHDLQVQGSANIIYLYDYYFTSDYMIDWTITDTDQTDTNAIFKAPVKNDDYFIYSFSNPDGSKRHWLSNYFRLTQISPW